MDRSGKKKKKKQPPIKRKIMEGVDFIDLDTINVSKYVAKEKKKIRSRSDASVGLFNEVCFLNIYIYSNDVSIWT